MSDSKTVCMTLKHGSYHYALLVDKYSDFLYGVSMRLTQGDKFLAEDLTQETFIKAYKYLYSFDAQKDFKKWLLSILYNSFKDIVSKRKAHELFNEDEHISSRLEPDNSGFYDLINPLNEKEQFIFTLKYIYEYTMKEISEMTRIKERALKEMIKEAKEKLR